MRRCRGVRDGAAETLLTEVKAVPEKTYFGKPSGRDDIAHIGDRYVFYYIYVSLAFLPPPLSETRPSSMAAFLLVCLWVWAMS